MARQYEVRGSGEKNIVVKVDGLETANMSISSDIQAENIFKSLDYHPGDTYELKNGGADQILEKPYEEFKEFLQSVIDGVNDVKKTAVNSIDGGEPAGDATALIDASTDDVYDEDIPF